VKRKQAILFAKSEGPADPYSMGHAIEHDEWRAASQVLDSRLFIDDALKQIQAPQKWNEIGRMPEDPTVGATQCAAKLDELIESIKRAAQEVTREEPLPPSS